MVASGDSGTLFVANADARQIAVVTMADRKVIGVIEMPSEPMSLALRGRKAALRRMCRAQEHRVRGRYGFVQGGRIASGRPYGVRTVPTPDSKRLYVCNRFNNDVSVIDLESGREIVRVPVARAARSGGDARWPFGFRHQPFAVGSR